MSKINQNDFINFINTKWSYKKCPICGNMNLIVGDAAYELREFNQGGIVVGSGKIIPIIPVMCPQCGYLILFNKIIVDKNNGASV